MTTHTPHSKIEQYRRPSGGLGGVFNGVEFDWEPGDAPIPYDARLADIWQALSRHMMRPRRSKEFVRSEMDVRK